MRLPYLLTVAFAGAATGLRSTIGMGALIEAESAGLPSRLTRRGARLAARLAVAGELVADKLPSTPSRLELPGLAARTAFGAASGAVLARATSHRVLPAVLLGSASALVGAKAGHDLRVANAQRFSPVAVAAAEDSVAIGLAALAAQTRWATT
jgi:uncharacterized membrane protein